MDNKKSPIRIVIADDHPIFRDGLRRLLEAESGLKVIGEACDGTEAVKLARQLKPDIMLLDLSMPGVQGFSGLIYLRSLSPQIPVVIVSANENPAVIRRCLEFGASGFIPKSLAVSRIREGVAAILRGEIWVPEGINPVGADRSGSAALIIGKYSAAFAVGSM